MLVGSAEGPEAAGEPVASFLRLYFLVCSPAVAMETFA